MSILGVHHIGVVVANVQEAANRYALLFGYHPVSEKIDDGVQKSLFIFIKLGETLVELIEPSGEDSPVAQFLQKGGGLHHICYLVDDLEAEMRRLRQLGAILVSSPVEAIAFDNRRIAFLYTEQEGLVELLEKG